MKQLHSIEKRDIGLLYTMAVLPELSSQHSATEQRERK
jgi:hypothetical protein